MFTDLSKCVWLLALYQVQGSCVHKNLYELHSMFTLLLKVLLALSILMDFPIQINAIRMELPIIHLKGSQIVISQV